MSSFVVCISNLASRKISLPLGYLKTILPSISALCNFHSSNQLNGINKWPLENEWVYEPQKPGEPRRPAWVCHYRENIKYSPKHMWYVASMIRGMSVDEALKQLSFVNKKGALIIKEVIQEAQELAVKEHNMEFKSNMWVAESYPTKALTIKGMRKHARMRFGLVHYRYCNYFLRLVEGPPPKHHYAPPLTGHEKLSAYFDELRSRKIHRTL